MRAFINRILLMRSDSKGGGGRKHRRETAVQIAETKSERIVSSIRIVLSIIGIILVFFLSTSERVPFDIGSLQLLVAVLVIIYSSLFFSFPQDTPLNIYISFISSFFNVTVITAVLWTAVLAGMPPVTVHLVFFPLYFLVIGFAYLHNRFGLSIFTGVIAFFEYFLLCTLVFEPLVEDILYIFLPSGTGLVFLSVIGEMVLYNNVRSVKILDQSEERYTNILNRLPIMTFTLDQDFRFKWTNSASVTEFGIHAEDLINVPVTDFLEGFPLNRVIERERYRGTFLIKKFTQEKMYADCMIQKTVVDGKTRWEGSMTDVTDRELSMGQREEMSNRMYQYKKTQSLGTLASGMAHDFNNILQTVNDISEQISKETDEENTKAKIETISESLADASFLISELLDIGRKRPLNKEVMDIGAFLKDIGEYYKSVLGNSFMVDVVLTNTDLMVNGDRNYLKRVFQNLFSNAKDAMPEGGTIKIEVGKEELSTGSYAVISFSDTGTGIPESLMDKIFDPFFTTKKKGKGTGLGLAMVKKVVQLHNGMISIPVSNSAGTVFRIELPLAEDVRDSDSGLSLPENRIDTSVIILDDDPKIRSILSFFLSDLSYKVYECGNSSECVMMLKRHSDECTTLIMDWKIEEEDPAEVIESVRSIKEDIIIFVVSGYQENTEMVKRYGITKWFMKPYDKNHLDYAIQRALRGIN